MSIKTKFSVKVSIIQTHLEVIKNKQPVMQQLNQRVLENSGKMNHGFPKCEASEMIKEKLQMQGKQLKEFNYFTESTITRGVFHRKPP